MNLKKAMAVAVITLAGVAAFAPAAMANSKFGNNPKNAAWIKNKASFSATGIGASVSGSGGGVSTSNGGAEFGREWTNTNNWIADLSGNVCGNGLTLYIGANSEAVAHVPQYGTPRSAIARV
ncbi:hypothetical protein [Crossiella sp. CA198]|uniref:hypothetical protein n=1 Tax=Crossiella sp. CA198 TaxID=3455607 RepID=UPI003F8D27C2